MCANILLLACLCKVSCQRFIGRAGRAYASEAQPDAKVVSSASAGPVHHDSPSSSQPSQPTKFVHAVLTY